MLFREIIRGMIIMYKWIMINVRKKTGKNRVSQWSVVSRGQFFSSRRPRNLHSFLSYEKSLVLVFFCEQQNTEKLVLLYFRKLKLKIKQNSGTKAAPTARLVHLLIIPYTLKLLFSEKKKNKKNEMRKWTMIICFNERFWCWCLVVVNIHVAFSGK